MIILSYFFNFIVSNGHSYLLKMTPYINALINVLCLSSGTDANFVSVNALKPFIESGQVDLADLKQKAEIYKCTEIIDLLDSYIVNGLPELDIMPYQSPLNDLDLSEYEYIEPVLNDVDHEEYIGEYDGQSERDEYSDQSECS